MSASELVEQRQQLSNDRKVLYEELTDFEERKRQLAELECHLNKQVCESPLNKQVCESPLNKQVC